MEAQDRPLLKQEDKQRTSEEYDDISDGAPDVRGLRSTNERRLWPWIVVTAITSALLFGLLGALACATLRDLQAYTIIEEPDCGDNRNVSEAIAKGCIFDQQSLAWVPEPCRSDPKSIKEYDDWLWDPARKPRPFPYFADQNGTVWLESKEKMSHFTGIIWTTWEEHMTHCAFMAKRFMRAWAQGRHIDPKMGNAEHARHCSAMLTKIIKDGMHNNSLINTRFHIDFMTCQMDRPLDNEEEPRMDGYRRR